MDIVEITLESFSDMVVECFPSTDKVLPYWQKDLSLGIEHIIALGMTMLYKF